MGITRQLQMPKDLILQPNKVGLSIKSATYGIIPSRQLHDLCFVGVMLIPSVDWQF